MDEQERAARVVSPTALRNVLGRNFDGACVLDVRGPVAFRRARLPASVRVDPLGWTRERAGLVELLRKRVARGAEADLRTRLQAAGLRRDRPLVVVGEGGGDGLEGRLAWALLGWGAEEVWLLDGGFRAWAASGAPVERGAPAPPREPGTFVPRPRPERWMDADGVRAALAHAGRPLLDVRTPREYAGARRLPLQRHGGHLPGARFVPFTALRGADGRFVDADALRALVSLRDGEAPITYCNGGGRSALLAFLLEARLGVPCAVYRGTVWEFAAREALPLERGGEERAGAR